MTSNISTRIVDWRDTNNGATCGVCGGLYEQGERLVAHRRPPGRSPHNFHKDCLSERLRWEQSCPMCDLPIDPESLKTQDQLNADRADLEQARIPSFMIGLATVSILGLAAKAAGVAASVGVGGAVAAVIGAEQASMMAENVISAGVVQASEATALTVKTAVGAVGAVVGAVVGAQVTSVFMAQVVGTGVQAAMAAVPAIFMGVLATTAVLGLVAAVGLPVIQRARAEGLRRTGSDLDLV